MLAFIQGEAISRAIIPFILWGIGSSLNRKSFAKIIIFGLRYVNRT